MGRFAFAALQEVGILDSGLWSAMLNVHGHMVTRLIPLSRPCFNTQFGEQPEEDQLESGNQ